MGNPHDDAAGWFLEDAVMRTLLIMATVAFGAAQLMWRVMKPSRQPAFAMEWTADE